MSTTQNKPRSVSMRWLKLKTDKDPEFGAPYFLFGNSGTKDKPTDDYQVGTLAGIKQSPEGKTFSWLVEGQEDERNHFTHYAICKKPTE